MTIRSGRSARRFPFLAILAAAALPLALPARILAADPPPADPAALPSAAEAAWGARAEGANGGVASPKTADAAVAAARAAFAAAPESVEARARLLRALFFRGAYCGASENERKTIFGEVKRLGDEGVARLEGKRKGNERLEALRKEPAAAPLFFWTAAGWGEWALAYGKWAAAKEGAAGRLRDLAQTVIDLDPAFEEGGGARILGRLHHQSPKIPFVTGWVSRDDALANLRKALASGPDNRANLFFLAEAMLDYESGRVAEARKLLEKAASNPPRPESRVEDAHFGALAARRLAEAK